MDFDEVTKNRNKVKFFSKIILFFYFTFVIKSRRSDDVPVGNVNSIDRIIRIVSCWVWLSKGGLPIILKKQESINRSDMYPIWLPFHK